MKRNLIFSLLLFLSLTSLSFAETVKISGGQTAGTGPFRDASIRSDPVELPSDGKVTKVEGSHAGFWINKVSRWGRETKLAGFSSSDEAIGYSLEAGTYTVYPNVPEQASGADVTLYVEVGGEIAKRKYPEKGAFNRELAQKLEKITKEVAQKLEWKYEGEVMQEYAGDRYAKGDRSWVAIREGGFIGDSQDGSLYDATFTLSVYLSSEVKRCSEKELREVMNNWREEVINYREIISTSVGPAINFGYSYKGKTKPKDSVCPYDSIQLHRSNYVITVGVSNHTQSTKYIKKGLTKQIFEGLIRHFKEILD